MITHENFEIWFLDYSEGKLNSEQEKMLFDFLAKNPDLKKQFDSFEQISINSAVDSSSNFSHLKKNDSWLFKKYSLDQLLFNYTEQLLSNDELKEFNEYLLNHPSLLKNVEKYRLLKLKPNKHYKFKNKCFLKHETEALVITPENFNEMVLIYAEEKNSELKKSIDEFILLNPSYQNELNLVLTLKLKPNLNLIYENKEQLKHKETTIVSIYWRYVAAAAAILLLVWLTYYPQDPKQNTIAKNKEVKNKNKANSLIEKKAKNNFTIANVNKNQFIVNKSSINKVKNNAIKSNNRKMQKSYNFLIEEKIDNLVNNNKIPIQKEEKNMNNDSLKNSTLNQIKNEEFAEIKQKNEYSSGINKPLEFVASVVNKSFYANKTPDSEVSNTFYAMRNVVHSVSGGNADIQKKEDNDYKEIKFNVGKFGFSRKKAKYNNNE